MWMMILIGVMTAVITGSLYLTVVIARSGFMKKISSRRLVRVLLAFLLIAAVFMALSRLISVVNTIIVFLHMIAFTVLYGLLFKILGMISGRKKDTASLQGLLALVTTLIYLSVGYYLCINVWQTDYNLTTNKQVGSLKAALFADSHIGSTFDGDGFAKHLSTIEAQSPDILFITGDFVDDWSNKKDLQKACQALGKTDFKYGVWLVYGNHDGGFFNSRDFDAKELKRLLTESGVHVLEDECVLVDDRFYVAGRQDASYGDRKDMDQLLSDTDKDKYTIVLDHQPNDYDNEAGHADLVLSGHTHGGQIIPIQLTSVLTGLVDRAYGHENRKGTDFIVTSGISDWELIFKTGTKSEYVILNIRQNPS